MRRAALIALVASIYATTARSEVCVVLDEQQHFVYLDIDTRPDEGLIWARTSDKPAAWCLNPGGDTFDDAFPTHSVIWYPDQIPARTSFRQVTEPEEEPPLRFTPVVIWSRFNGLHWDLVFSFWSYQINGWDTIRFVEASSNSTDDLNPVATNEKNHVRLHWERHGVHVATVTALGRLMIVGPQVQVIWSTAELVPNAPQQLTGSENVPPPLRSW